jgi:hypothetical protein
LSRHLALVQTSESMLEQASEPVPFTATDARNVTDAIKADPGRRWKFLLDASECKAYTALGYKSWRDYAEAEFTWQPGHTNKLVRAGRVLRAIDNYCAIKERPARETVARRLVPFLTEGDKTIAEIWTAAVTMHGPTPTATQVSATIAEIRPTLTQATATRPAGKLMPAQLRFQRGLTNVVIATELLDSFLQKEALAASFDYLALWKHEVSKAQKSLERISRRLSYENKRRGGQTI